MRTEQKIFNELIETIVNNSENNEAKITNVELWAKTWKEEMKQALTLTDVVGSAYFAAKGMDEVIVLAENIADAMDKLEESKKDYNLITAKSYEVIK